MRDEGGPAEVIVGGSIDARRTDGERGENIVLCDEVTNVAQSLAPSSEKPSDQLIPDVVEA